MRAIAGWLRRRAENVAAAMLAVMFCAFLVQIVFRYVFGLPTGWANELTLVAWLWLVLWGAAFVLRDRDEIRFDLLTSLAGRRTRTAMGVLASSALVALYLASLPAAYDYVSFMRVERSSYLKIRLDWLYSIYVVFVVAIVVRHVLAVIRLLRGGAPGDADPIPPPGAP